MYVVIMCVSHIQCLSLFISLSLSLFVQVVTSAVSHLVPAVDSLIADESAISELMNKAWSSHEITDYQIEHVSNSFYFN